MDRLNILFLFDGYHKFNDRIIAGFTQKLSKLCELHMYGPNEHERNKEIAPLQYKKEITSKDLVEHFHPDIILFQIYNRKSMSWYPKDICNVGVPTALIENDHYPLIEDLAININNVREVIKWYKTSGLSLLIRKHFYEEKPPINAVWLPPCANEEEFYPNTSIKRENKISFAGSVDTGKYYIIRHNALALLKNNNLTPKDTGKLGAGAYPPYLRKYVGALACGGGPLHTPLSKTFEIILSGTALMSQWLHGTKELFGDKQCFFEYKDDCSNVLEVANKILNDNTMVKEVTSNALERVRKYHTDTERIKDLHGILKALIEGKEVPRRWGQ